MGLASSEGLGRTVYRSAAPETLVEPEIANEYLKNMYEDVPFFKGHLGLAKVCKLLISLILPHCVVSSCGFLN